MAAFRRATVASRSRSGSSIGSTVRRTSCSSQARDAGRLEDAYGVNGLDLLGHSSSEDQITKRPTTQLRPCGASGDANQGREMTVAVRENERLDPTDIRSERIADRARRCDSHSALTIVQPGSIQHRIARRLERPLSAPESFDIGCRLVVGAAVAEPLKIPAQFVLDDISQQHRDLRPRLVLHPVSKAGHVRR